ncbi:DUF3046 domain-containing protein [Vallicoccus soli]|uniref:DUF3046 domain-containing protein n=1 Tax=Vallicoccus soli TaxID=2339232 RepID=A0A3A3Z1R4_9ACTN|nr:DUF3046 domain-containing protein [Vallicoccus soli]RJK96477.1 DUF3046 domain-containing protein [Vallicoccus soli]
MRLTVFWERMREHFGPLTDPFARDHVLAALGQRTVEQALADGEPAKDVWRAVCAEMDVPARLR